MDQLFSSQLGFIFTPVPQLCLRYSRALTAEGYCWVIFQKQEMFVDFLFSRRFWVSMLADFWLQMDGMVREGARALPQPQFICL